MSLSEEQATGLPASLADRLRSDSKGELRDSTVQTLHAMEDQIHATLSGPLGAEDAAVLKSLLDAVALGERELLSAWDSFHFAPSHHPASWRK